MKMMNRIKRLKFEEERLSKDIVKMQEKTAIFFPELIRYSFIRDLLETTALEYLYIENGKNYADFSIGRMQMKPSFIEIFSSMVS